MSEAKSEKELDRAVKQWFKKLDTDIYEQRVELIPLYDVSVTCAVCTKIVNESFSDVTSTILKSMKQFDMYPIYTYFQTNGARLLWFACFSAYTV
jgi:hypothetical protein